uniref:Uncharacterized protein n=1 Tax=Vitis vinifera TaxID=29760 RepID=A5AN97_VITVI|nr:hypothetical protein VITISV_027803 [Vitis vinifera]
MARSPIRTPSMRSTWHSRISHSDDSISYPDMLSGSLTKSEGTGVMIGRLSRSLTAAHRVMMALPPPRGIMTSQKVYPPLKREAELLTLYKRAFTQGKRSIGGSSGGGHIWRTRDEAKGNGSDMNQSKKDAPMILWNLVAAPFINRRVTNRFLQLYRKQEDILVFPLISFHFRSKNLEAHNTRLSAKRALPLQVGMRKLTRTMDKQAITRSTVHHSTSASSSLTTMGEPCSWPPIHATSSWQKRGPLHLKNEWKRNLPG